MRLHDNAEQQSNFGVIFVSFPEQSDFHSTYDKIIYWIDAELRSSLTTTPIQYESHSSISVQSKSSRKLTLQWKKVWNEILESFHFLAGHNLAQ